MTLANLKLNICICVNFMIFFKKCKILLTKEKGELLGSPFFYTSGGKSAPEHTSSFCELLGSGCQGHTRSLELFDASGFPHGVRELNGSNVGLFFGGLTTFLHNALLLFVKMFLKNIVTSSLR
ncbi:hypothetical protein M0P65_05725 [Candidatus Gracilibacteria bacterium]|nr:hypothetical protein [Candidatus Gracilibacteria bacterium]